MNPLDGTLPGTFVAVTKIPFDTEVMDIWHPKLKSSCSFFSDLEGACALKLICVSSPRAFEKESDWLL